MKLCFGYIRVSTQKQGEGVSLEAQKEAIQNFAGRHELTVEQWFEEKETAAKSGRPVFNAMLRELRRRKSVGLVMHKIDRSARNLRDWAAIHELSDAGVDVHFANESLDFRSRGGRLTADIQAVIAADYIRNLREETTKGLRGRLRQGLYPFRAPIGYLDNGRGKPKSPCPLKAPLIRQAYELYATGQYSIRTLRQELERLGLRGHCDQPLSLHGVETILSNPFYTGVIVIKRTGDVYEGVHEPILETSLFQRVQDVKAGKAGKKVTRHNHLFRGLFRCGLCKGPMTPEKQKGHVYYRCQTRDCLTKTIREELMDRAVLEALENLQLSADDALALERQWLGWIEDDGSAELAESLNLQIEHCQKRLDRLTDLLIDEQITSQEYNRRKTTYLQELAELKSRHHKASQKAAGLPDVTKFLELMKSLCRLYEIADDREKRQMVEIFFSNRIVIKKTLIIEPYSWLESRDPARLSPSVTRLDPLLELMNGLQSPTEERSNSKAAEHASFGSQRRTSGHRGSTNTTTLLGSNRCHVRGEDPLRFA